MGEKKYIMEDEKKLDNFIKIVSSVKTVKSCKEWDWKRRYPDFETAVNALLRQLELQRELLLISIIWQKRNLLKQSLNNSKPN